MDYGLYLSLSAIQTHMARQDVFANNLANVRTPGFKPDIADVRQRAPQSVEGNHGFDSAHELMDRLGGGVWSARHRINFSPGPRERTERPLDVALDGDDSFFVVGVAGSDGGGMETRLTRAGQFVVGPDGHLVTVAGGHQVLDDQDQPIRVDVNRPVMINSEGRVLQGDQEVASLGVSQILDLQALVKDQRNLFRLEGDAELRQPARNRLMHEGFIEASGVDPITALMDVTGAGRAVGSNATLLRYHDQLMDQAINTLGRVA
ncbi:MAG: flagellar hook-basal body complex protein [Phycisphaeraceae bacterium]|nr:flagellar hook-basal body complex protein [Phycisphaeraceae bacterium]